MPWSAWLRRRRPSKEKGLVTTPTVRAPISSRAISATMGAAPVPVPPPSPAVTKTMSASASASRISARLSSAAWQPTWGLAPAPRPRVSSSPMWMVLSASDMRRAWRSVFTAMNSTPRTPASTMRFTAFVPPPPTPTTLMTAKCSEPGMFGISSSTPVAFYCCVCLVSARRCSGAPCGPPKGGIYAGHCTRCPFVCNANHRQRSLQIHEYDKKPTASRFAGRQSGQPRRASQGSEASDRIVFSLPGKTLGRRTSRFCSKS